jgi:Spy/CpxP family protein refolding chaperone
MPCMARQLLQDEPKDLAQQVHEAMQAHRSELRQAFKKLRRARRDMAEILKDPQATEADISAGFTAMRMADNNLKALSYRVLTSALPTLLPQQRLAFAMQETGRIHHGKPKARPPY